MGPYFIFNLGLYKLSSLVRVLVCQPSGPGPIPGMSRSESAITRGNPIMLLSPTTFLLTACQNMNFQVLSYLPSNMVTGTESGHQIWLPEQIVFFGELTPLLLIVLTTDCVRI